MLVMKAIDCVRTQFPKAQLAAWVYTEKGNFDLPELVTRLKTLPQDKIAAMIVDNPRAFAEVYR